MTFIRLLLAMPRIAIAAIIAGVILLVSLGIIATEYAAVVIAWIRGGGNIGGAK